MIPYYVGIFRYSIPTALEELDDAKDHEGGALRSLEESGGFQQGYHVRTCESEKTPF